MPIQDVERVALETLGDLGERLNRHQSPLVISGGGRDWPCTRTWTLRGLAGRFGQVKIPVRESDDEFKEFFGRPDSHLKPRKMMPFGAYITMIENSNNGGTRPPYAGNISLSRDPALSGTLRHLISECPFPNWLPEGSIDEYRLWIGAAGQKSTIHNDPYHNFNLQIIGRKSVLLYPPDQHDAIYAEYFNPGMWVSPVDPNAPDLEKYRKFADAKTYSCEIAPGDILFIPRFWWHSVCAMEISVNVNRWIFTDNIMSDWWHKQPMSQRFIRHQALIDRITSDFNSLHDDLKEFQRSAFEEMRADLLRLERLHARAEAY
jgi:Cupin-like domain